MILMLVIAEVVLGREGHGGVVGRAWWELELVKELQEKSVL